MTASVEQSSESGVSISMSEPALTVVLKPSGISDHASGLPTQFAANVLKVLIINNIGKRYFFMCVFLKMRG